MSLLDNAINAQRIGLRSTLLQKNSSSGRLTVWRTGALHENDTDIIKCFLTVCTLIPARSTVEATEMM